MRRSIGGLLFLGVLLLGPDAAVAQDGNPFSNCKPGDPRRFNGSREEAIEGRPGAVRITLTGDVSIVCNDTTLFADEVVYEDDTRLIRATGNVTFQQPDLSVYAERAELNGGTKLGTFYRARGTASLGAAPAEKSLFGTLEPEIMFHADELAKTGPATYRLKGGAFTSCVQPTPRWEFVGSNATIVLDKYVLMKHMVLRVKDVPLLYLPAMYYPLSKEGRSTGFLLPTYGSSTIGGTSLSNAFFWAISRSQDATFYHDWNAKTGQGVKTEYRYVASPGSQGRADFHLLNERALLGSDGTVISAPRRSYRVNGNVFQGLPRGFRLSANANYFTNAATQQRYQNIDDYSQRQRSWNATLAGTVKRLRLSVTADQSDLFYGTTQGQRSGRLPSVNIALSDQPIGRTRIYYGASGDISYILRQDDVLDPTSNRSLARFDATPTIRAPLSRLPYLTATGSASWRITRWLESIDPATGLQVPVALTRQLLDMRASVTGPVLSRVFQTPDNGYAERFKHLIEPTFSIQRTTPFLELDRAVFNDYTDSIVGGTTTINYRLSNRLLARRRGPTGAPGAPAAPGIVREILTVELGQSYYSDARAARFDPEYQTGGSGDGSKGTFSALQLSVVTRPTDTMTGQFRAEIDSKYRKVREYSATGTADSSRVQVSAGWAKRQVIPELQGFGPEYERHFLNANTTIRTLDNKLGGTYGLYYDVKNTAFLQQRIVAYYNSQCCGISFDWQSISTPLYPGIPSDVRFGISFTLAGIGSFSNPMGSFGGR